MPKPKLSISTHKELQRVFKDNSAFAGFMQTLPNPDPILRKSGKTQTVYDAIERDSHVIGEVRALRSGMLAFEAELVPGGDDAASMESYELCKAFFARRPAQNTLWHDVDWQMYSAVLRGFSVIHLAPYEKDKSTGHWLPSAVEMWDAGAFMFDTDGQLRLKTTDDPNGIVCDKSRWICTRHMPTKKNPYGIALLSSCLWPWTFKRGGWQQFVLLAERFGLPFPIAKYPAGTTSEDVDKLLVGLQKLLIDGLAALPDNNTIELLQNKGAGEPIPERLVALCNREMSKALSSQTLASEQHGSGSRAASQTHAERAGENQRADRVLVADGRNQLCEAIHAANFNSGNPPKYKFKDEKQINEKTVAMVKAIASLLPVSEEWAYTTLAVPRPADSDTILQVQQTPAEPTQSADFSQATTLDAFDLATSNSVQSVAQLMSNATDLHDFKRRIQRAFSGIGSGAINDVMRTTFTHDFLAGAQSAETQTIEDFDDE